MGSPRSRRSWSRSPKRRRSGSYHAREDARSSYIVPNDSYSRRRSRSSSRRRDYANRMDRRGDDHGYSCSSERDRGRNRSAGHRRERRRSPSDERDKIENNRQKIGRDKISDRNESRSPDRGRRRSSGRRDSKRSEHSPEELKSRRSSRSEHWERKRNEAENRESSEEEGEIEEKSHVIHIKGLPKDAVHVDLQKLFSVVPGVVAVRLDMELEDDSDSGRRPAKNSRGMNTECTGNAYLEMADVESAAALLSTGWKDQAHYGTHRLDLQYFIEGNSRHEAIDYSTDWRCPACSDVNFSKRKKCRKCLRPRTAAAEAVDRTQPSSSLRFEGLPASNEAVGILELAIKPIVPVQRIKLMRGRNNNVPTGVAIVHLFSKDDASKVMQKLIKDPMYDSYNIEYALEGMGENTQDSKPLEHAAEAELNAVGWEPATFDEAALDVSVDKIDGSSTDGFDENKNEKALAFLEKGILPIQYNTQESAIDPKDRPIDHLAEAQHIGSNQGDIQTNLPLATIEKPLELKLGKNSSASTPHGIQHKIATSLPTPLEEPKREEQSSTTRVRGVIHRGKWAGRSK